MSRQAGSIVRGISKPRRISVKRAGSRWRLCTAGAAKGQATPETSGQIIRPKAPELGSVKIRDFAGRSGRATTHEVFQWVRHRTGTKRPPGKPCKPGPLSHFRGEGGAPCADPLIQKCETAPRETGRLIAQDFWRS